MHVLIVGGRGQLGRALQQAFEIRPDIRLTLWNRPEHDIISPQITGEVAQLAPDVVINAAAWTNVDGAETDPDGAYAANMLGPKYLAEGCAACHTALVQVSTNEVFSGEPGRCYREYDQPSARSVYARSKLAGERAARHLLDRLYIVRVAWLFGPGGDNFPAKIVRAADRHGALRVVNDEFGNPTYAPDVAAALVALVDSGRYGIYHLVNEGYTSRYDLACHVLACAGRGHVPVTPIPAREWPRPATPPLHAVLVNQAAAALGITLRPWQEAVEDYCRREFAREEMSGER
ncbi:MAG: dTDP-4-dehydrorhamnose reductase [Caldilineaceae bacterium]|nr:dTDP-4-dehydrorhamnose reductase [Caldilineaceae bacterium]